MFEVACNEVVRIVRSQYMGDVGCVCSMLLKKQNVFLKGIHLHCVYNVTRNAVCSGYTLIYVTN